MKKSPMPNDRDVNPFDASRHRSELRRVVRQIQALTLEPDNSRAGHRERMLE
jgi:hypothetical protein